MRNYALPDDHTSKRTRQHYCPLSLSRCSDLCTSRRRYHGNGGVVLVVDIKEASPSNRLQVKEKKKATSSPHLANSTRIDSTSRHALALPFHTIVENPHIPFTASVFAFTAALQPQSCSFPPTSPHLTAILSTLAALSTALTALLTDTATAQHGQTRAQTTPVLLLFRLRRRWALLVLHLLLALGRVVHLLLLLLRAAVLALGRSVARE
jgi:hypothetical protein